MGATYSNAVVVGLSGPLKGKKFKLKGTTLALGNGPDADIVVPGVKVSGVHAVLELLETGQWAVRNKSEYGVLVNALPVEVQPLEPGDTLQIGEQVVFRMDVKVKNAPTSGGKKQKDKARSGTSRKPIMVAGISSYLIAMVVLAIFLVGKDGGDSGGTLDKPYIVAVLAKTEKYLLEETRKKQSGASGDEAVSMLDRRADAAAAYYSIINTSDDAEKQRLIEELLTDVQGHFFRGWAFEERGNFTAAIKEYRRIHMMLPSVKAPAAQAALWRQSLLQDRLVDE
jgi:pSer/pThr/pTyr-binding forkhead associated (FHA) protein